jgi:creatinine amidohydrolase
MMQVRWEYLTPPDFKKLAKEEKLCILPIGSLERHGDHMPFGTDGIICHEICVRAAETEPCVVFPTYWFGQVHEAACFAGTVNFPTDFLCKQLEILLDQIAANGFEKILIVSGHGGNFDFLHYFAMSQNDREVDYTLYTTFAFGGERFEGLKVWENPIGGHADEQETSMIMAAAPGTVKLDYQTQPEPILPKHDLSHLGKRISTGLWWYDNYPENVTGAPSLATPEKGEAAMAAAADDMAELIRIVKADTVLPAMQREFYGRVRAKREHV